MVMRNKPWAKKIIKFRMQKDFMIANTVMGTFCILKLFKEIDWNLIWLLSPIWILLSIYAICTIFALIFGYFYNKKKRTFEKWESMGKSQCGRYCISPKYCECFKSLKR